MSRLDTLLALATVLAAIALFAWSLSAAERDRACVDRELSEHRPTIDCFEVHHTAQE